MRLHSHRPVPIKCTESSPWTGVKIGSTPKSNIILIPTPPYPEFNVETAHSTRDTCYFNAGVPHFNIEFKGHGGDGNEGDTAFGW